MKLGHLLWIGTSVVAALQSPLSLFDVAVPHYLSVDESEWPVDLRQYQQMVIRADYSADGLAKVLATKSVANFSVWAKDNTRKTVDLQIDEPNLMAVLEQLPELEFEIVIDDLPQKVFESYPRQNNDDDNDIQVSSELFFREHRRLKIINGWLDMLQESYPEVLAIEELGKSAEGRPLRLIHFSVPTEDIDHADKETIVVTGGTHAREWIGTSSVLYTLYSLVDEWVADPKSKRVTELNYIFIPVVNPDGYEYTWTHDRLWRKNRQSTSHPNCYGVDIDHSYDYHWTKSSDWPCGDEYSGEEPFEAAESRLWSEYLNATNEQHHIAGYIDLHSYSQEVLYPYAYSCSEQPRDEENLVELAYGISKTIRLRSGAYYSVLPACIDKDSDMLPDMGSGSALDYMYHNKAYWAYQLKLRDTGQHGFLLPGKYIEPVGEEVFAGIKFFLNFILSDEHRRSRNI
ncbi:inactive metallocarboxypeptidase Ecm14p [Diutina catenulata]